MDSSVRARPDLPCAGCRTLHRKCSHNCMLAPYFPSDEPEKFASVHKVFGASNVIKLLLMVEEGRREDAVKSMVYEAHARLRDPVYGCTTAISYLQKCVEDLKGQLKTTRQQVLESQEQRDRLLRILMDDPYLKPTYLPAGTTVCGGGSSFMFDNMMHDDHFGSFADNWPMI
ncbi:LOB domain-containing protein 25-like [Elaeis guineensis]|uniref:LOB domain-containing protein 25-like n=1 Tax=Elaeis guineensis var. tenera TaxID=51953 RepID=A0A6I9RFS6_ELAGV|nr:LOB domain-containing protein 25-like [Elaeis guineensis]